MPLPPPADGNHVRLRPWRVEDARDIAVMAHDDHVRRWSSLPADVEAWLARERAEARGPSRAICLAGDDRALGKVALRLPGRASPATTCSAIVASDHPVAELSYWLVPEARGRGLAHRAVVAMMRTVADTTDVRSVVLDIEEGNAASMRLAERLGAERREPSRVELDRTGVSRTLVVFVLAVARYPRPLANRPAGGCMDYRQLGRSGLRFSELILGTMGFGGGGQFSGVGQIDLDGAKRQIDLALDAGINVIDTADIYTAGASEEIIGRALEGRRDRLLVATKGRFAMGDGPNDAGLSRHHLIEACEASLRRLRTDHIDLYQVHEWDGQTPLEETLAALEHLLQSGKVRYVGCSNFAGWQVTKALGIAARDGLPRFASQQVYLSLQERSAEYEIVPSAIDQGLGLLIWSPLAGGLMSGKYRRNQPPPEGARHTSEWSEPPVYDEDKLYDTIEVLVEVAEAHGVSAAQVALAWLLARPGVTSLVIGARTEEQLADNLAAASLELSAEEHERLEQVSRPPLIYPFWHQRASASERLSEADLSLIGPYLE